VQSYEQIKLVSYDGTFSCVHESSVAVDIPGYNTQCSSNNDKSPPSRNCNTWGEKNLTITYYTSLSIPSKI